MTTQSKLTKREEYILELLLQEYVHTATPVGSRRLKKEFAVELSPATIRNVLSDPKYREAWDAYPFNSGYFMCLKLHTVDAEELRVHLLDKYGVGLISLGPTDLRVAFSCIDKEDVRELFDTVFQGVKDLEG